MRLLGDATILFVLRWKTMSGVLICISAVAIVYTIRLLTSDSYVSPLWMIWWALSGSYGAALGEIGYRRYRELQKTSLEKSLSIPSRFKWSIFTTDGARIGDISEEDYLRAKNAVDFSLSTKFLQTMNYLWILWCCICRFITFLPSIAIPIIFLVVFSTPKDILEALTLGQLLVGISEKPQILMNIIFSIFIVYVFSLVVSGKPLPGYKNYAGLRLKRLISRHVPNIANSDGFDIVGYEIPQ